MRILLFSGKGGIGKTSLAAATGNRLAELGNVRRHTGLPNSMTGLSPVRASLQDGVLVVELKETQ